MGKHKMMYMTDENSILIQAAGEGEIKKLWKIGIIDNYGPDDAVYVASAETPSDELARKVLDAEGYEDVDLADCYFEVVHLTLEEDK